MPELFWIPSAILAVCLLFSLPVACLFVYRLSLKLRNRPGTTIELRFLGVVIRVVIPPAEQPP
jgi:hypothetical protein